MNVADVKKLEDAARSSFGLVEDETCTIVPPAEPKRVTKYILEKFGSGQLKF